jgi:hypothetical protein
MVAVAGSTFWTLLKGKRSILSRKFENISTAWDDLKGLVRRVGR